MCNPQLKADNCQTGRMSLQERIRLVRLSTCSQSDPWPDCFDVGSPRDRMQQTVYLVTQTDANIGPEADTSYTARVYNENSGLQ